MIFDIDNFKKINDQYGHLKGDEILRRLGNILNRSRRDLDICARYGGEEFAIILPHTDCSEALAIAERVRKEIEEYFQNDLKVTVSIGVSNCPDSSVALKTLIKKADNALYESKKTGRNRTSCK